MMNPKLTEVYIEGYPMPLYDDGRMQKSARTWIVDFEKMKTFDNNGKEINRIGRRSNGEWFFGEMGSRSTLKLPTPVAVELEQAYVKWLNRMMTE